MNDVFVYLGCIGSVSVVVRVVRSMKNSASVGVRVVSKKSAILFALAQDSHFFCSPFRT
jgi:hypothetical protein